jgi:hypothetical protein
VEAEDAIGRCERPDSLIQLAWEAGLDKKAVIREGSDAARLLLAGEWTELLTLFWPVPRPLEAVDRWSENLRSRTTETLRPFASAVVPGTVLGSLAAHFWIAPWVSNDGLTLVGSIVASFAIVGVLFKVLIEHGLRRQVARLDEESALAIVLEQLRAGMAMHPAMVPHAVTRTRKEIQKLMADIRAQTPNPRDDGSCP